MVNFNFHCRLYRKQAALFFAIIFAWKTWL